jgi:hypothetical protein
MKTYLITHWKIIVICILLILIGVILAKSCGHKTQTSHQVSIDSLQQANTITQHRYDELSDSVNQVILEKDKTALELTKSIQAITAKYELIRHRNPVHDTIVKDSIVFNGNEALEKIPVMETQLLNCENKVENYKQLVMVKTNQNIALQKDFNRALSISKDQEKNIKKLNRKTKWLKIGLVSETVLILGAAAFVIAQ